MQPAYPISPKIVLPADVIRADAGIPGCRCKLAEAVARAAARTILVIDDSELIRRVVLVVSGGRLGRLLATRL